MENKTFYNILGVKSSCSTDEIKNAYRKIIKQIHPDKQGDSTDVKKINMAYATLKNPAKRREYDNSIKNIKKSQNDFMEIKKNFQDFLKAQNINSKNYEDAHKEFEKAHNEYKAKCKQYLDKYVNNDEDNFNDKLTQLELSREQEYIESIPIKPSIINDSLSSAEFSKQFNEMFEQSEYIHDGVIEHNDNIIPYNNIDSASIDTINVINVNEEDNEYLKTYFNKNNLGIDKTYKNTIQNQTIEENIRLRELETEELMNIKNYKNNEIINASGETATNVIDDTKYIF
jgi:curved DNA-binding protein CbpA